MKENKLGKRAQEQGGGKVTSACARTDDGQGRSSPPTACTARWTHSPTAMKGQMAHLRADRHARA